MKAVRALFGEFRTGQGLKGQLLRGGAGSLVIKIASTLMALVLAIVLARLLGPEGFGIYSFVFALITILAIPAQMGLPNLVVRETAKAQVAERWDLMKGLWRWSSLVALAMSAALIVLGALAAWLFAEQLGPVQAHTLWWGLLLIPLVALGNLRGAALRGLRKVVQGQLPEFVLRPLFFVVLALVAWGLFGTDLGPAEAMMLHGIAALAAFAIGAWLLLRGRPPELVAQVTSSTEGKAWLASAVPLGMVEGMHLINGTFGLIVLGFVASAEDVGLFRLALLGGGLVGFAHLAIDMVVSPHFARLHAKKDVPALQRLVTAAARIGLALAVPAALFFIVLGHPLLSLLFGEAYGGAYVALAIVSIGVLVSVLAGPAGQLLHMGGREKDVMVSAGIAAAIVIALSVPFVLAWGIEGAAFAVLISRTAMAALFIYFAHRRFGIDSTILAPSIATVQDAKNAP